MFKIKTTQNNNKIVFNNYQYLKDRENGEISYYKCEYFKKFKCRGRIHVVDENVVKEVGDHNHPSDKSKYLADEVVNQIKVKAVETKENPREILREISTDVSFPIAAKLPSMQLLKKTISRKRKSEEIFCPPSSLDFQIPDDLQRTNNMEKFLLFDSGCTSQKRMLIFGTEFNLNMLEKHKHWYADGTFDSTPALFTQIFTIHIIVGGNVLPMIYALLPDKRETTYGKVLEELKKLNHKLDPCSIMSDFEKG